LTVLEAHRAVGKSSQYSAEAESERERAHVDNALRELAAVLVLDVLKVSLVLVDHSLGVEDTDDDCGESGKGRRREGRESGKGRERKRRLRESRIWTEWRCRCRLRALHLVQ
jgi:hypothetical protein